jgi:hypothetical protein
MDNFNKKSLTKKITTLANLLQDVDKNILLLQKYFGNSKVDKITALIINSCLCHKTIVFQLSYRNLLDLMNKDPSFKGKTIRFSLFKDIISKLIEDGFIKVINEASGRKSNTYQIIEPSVLRMLDIEPNLTFQSSPVRINKAEVKPVGKRIEPNDKIKSLQNDKWLFKKGTIKW